MNTSKFKNIEQVLTDPQFAVYLASEIESIKTKRRLVLSGAKLGSRLRRTPFDFLSENGYMTVMELSNEFRRILSKTTSLSAANRAYIKDVVVLAMSKTVDYYKDKE